MGNKLKDEEAFLRVVKRFTKQNVYSIRLRDFHNNKAYDIRIYEGELRSSDYEKE